MSPRSNNYAVSKFISKMKQYKFKIEEWEPNKEFFPPFMFLGGDRGILAYVQFKIINHSTQTYATDLNDMLKVVSCAESELDRPVFFVYIDEATDSITFETNEQIKDRLYYDVNSVDSQKQWYIPEKHDVGDFNNLIRLFSELKTQSVRFH